MSHGHILVNGRKVDRPSYMVSVGELVSVKEKSGRIQPVQDGLSRRRARGEIPYIDVDIERVQGKLKSLPRREEIPVNIDDSLVVEYYSKYL